MVESLKIELFSTQRELVEKTDECELMEKEITQVKDMFRQTLEERQQQLKIIEEYQTITSNLSKRLHADESKDEACEHKHSIKNLPKFLPTSVVSKLADCEMCSSVLDEQLPCWRKQPSENSIALSHGDEDEDDEFTKLYQKVKHLELELAESKVRLVDEQCQRQDVNHQLQRKCAALERCQEELEVAKSSNPKQWFVKKLTNIRAPSQANSTNLDTNPASIASAGASLS